MMSIGNVKGIKKAMIPIHWMIVKDVAAMSVTESAGMIAENKK